MYSNGKTVLKFVNYEQIIFSYKAALQKIVSLFTSNYFTVDLIQFRNSVDRYFDYKK